MHCDNDSQTCLTGHYSPGVYPLRFPFFYDGNTETWRLKSTEVVDNGDLIKIQMESKTLQLRLVCMRTACEQIFITPFVFLRRVCIPAIIRGCGATPV